MRPKVGIDITASADGSIDPLALAVEAEELGFDFVSANDHPCGSHPTHEIWTLLTWVAARTSHIRIASRVLGLSYRPPAMVAKMASSLNLLSGGRLILGLGGGSADEEVRALGLPVPTPGEKVRGLREAIRIIRGLWTQSEFSYEGEIFSTVRATIEPKPRRRIPIWLGTFGPQALKVTGELADGWIPSLGMAPPHAIGDMRSVVLDAAYAAGRRPEEIECVYNLEIALGRSARDETILAGTPGEVAERLREFADLGFSAFNLIPAGRDRVASMRRIATHLLPLLHGR